MHRFFFRQQQSGSRMKNLTGLLDEHITMLRIMSVLTRQLQWRLSHQSSALCNDSKCITGHHCQQRDRIWFCCSNTLKQPTGVSCFLWTTGRQIVCWCSLPTSTSRVGISAVVISVPVRRRPGVFDAQFAQILDPDARFRSIVRYYINCCLGLVADVPTAPVYR
jgi:hypothetical protein